jgi:hypothetical protein
VWHDGGLSSFPVVCFHRCRGANFLFLITRLCPVAERSSSRFDKPHPRNNIEIGCSFVPGEVRFWFRDHLSRTNQQNNILCQYAELWSSRACCRTSNMNNRFINWGWIIQQSTRDLGWIKLINNTTNMRSIHNII